MFTCSLTALCKPRMLGDGCSGFVSGISRGMNFSRKSFFTSKCSSKWIFTGACSVAAQSPCAPEDARIRHRSVTSFLLLFWLRFGLLFFLDNRFFAGRMAVAGSGLCRRGCGCAKVGLDRANLLFSIGLWRMAGRRGRGAAPAMVRFYRLQYTKLRNG